MIPETEVLVGKRGAGKTHAAIRWVIEGHAIDGWPGWSRVIVVPYAHRVPQLIGEFPELQAELWGKGNGGLGKLVLSLDEARRVLPQHRDVEFVLDDAQEVIAGAIGAYPAMVTVDGSGSEVKL